MSVAFWRDVRRFHELLNLAHDGVLTSTELKVTFPKVLEGAFGLKNGQLSSMSYKEALEAYINRLYSAAYPEYYTSKLAAQQQRAAGIKVNAAVLPADILTTRSELPLLLPHFEQDFIFGLGKEEEAVLNVDLQHSISTIEQYYKNIDIAVEQQHVKQYLPLFIKALRNTGYIPDNLQIVDLIIHMSSATLPTKPEEELPTVDDSTPKQYAYHIELSKIRLLFVAIAAFLYDSHKARAIALSYKYAALGTSTNPKNAIKPIFDQQIPDLLAKQYIVQEVDEANEAQLLLQQMLGIKQQTAESQVDEEGNTIGKLPDIFKKDQDQSKTTNKKDDILLSDHINLVFKYMIYALSAKKYITSLIKNYTESYNPFTAYTSVKTTEEEIMSSNKTDKEKNILLQIHQNQVTLAAKHEDSKNMQIVTQFSLKELLNIVFRTFKHTANIKNAMIKINDYIGEVTYGEEEDDELDALYAILGNKPNNKNAVVCPQDDLPLDFEAEGERLMEQEKQSNNNSNNNNNTQSSEITASMEETIKLMNARWLTPIRRSFDWTTAFVTQELVQTTHGNKMVFAKLDGQDVSLNPVIVKKMQQDQDEQRIIDGFASFDLAEQMRSRRR